MTDNQRKVVAKIIMAFFGVLILYCVGSFCIAIFTQLGIFSDLLKVMLYGVWIFFLVALVVLVAISPAIISYGLVRWAVATLKGQKL